MIGVLIGKGYVPSFCAACYRRERTGAAFMSLARPGLIRHKCDFNALVTLKEYLDDFASDPVRKAGYSLLGRERKRLAPEAQAALSACFLDIDRGVRDSYV
jgi:2-iminoacetate synthase